MYATCLFCNGSLGTNEVIERFPVGRRLAFDAAKGRLWVVCTSCRRWNLTPLEERWEAIEDAERRFRGTRLRVSTGEIGLARLNEGLELVRVGAPQRPEIAAWRYGEQFGRRRRRQLVTSGVVLGAAGLALAGGVAAGLGLWIAWSVGTGVMRTVERGFPRTTMAHVRLPGGRRVPIRRQNLADSTLLTRADGTLAFELAWEDGLAVVEGAEARNVARQLFPKINRQGGTPEEVRRAVARVEHAGDAESFLRHTAQRGEKYTRRIDRATSSIYEDPDEVRSESGLLALSTSLGLAIEMALHEEQERLALEGELSELEAAWREAEEIGAIADSLLLPDSVERAWSRLRGQ
ncbi:MAG: hypothetical protein JWL60_953 [Gemmatimonadetes bacterium]|nr:hypothetical protein [Gemmatimonadota bacterium]